jgi:hypothetical protein
MVRGSFERVYVARDWTIRALPTPKLYPGLLTFHIRRRLHVLTDP